MYVFNVHLQICMNPYVKDAAITAKLTANSGLIFIKLALK